MSARSQVQVEATIRRHRMLRAGDRVGVAVSGGADSVALLLLLLELREKLGITLLVAHFNHQLRGAESDTDEAFVRELAARHGLEFVAGRADVAARARENRWNLEDAARRLRYAFFEELVTAGRADRIAVGHTVDDQAETVLARLARGTGPAGLAGIYPVVGHVVRPLLETRREELRRELRKRGQEWREDASNRDMARLRARVRHSVLPHIERELQSAAVKHLSELASLVREDESFWAAVVQSCFVSSVAANDAGLSISIADMLEPKAIAGPLGHVAGDTRVLEAVSKRLIRRLAAESRGQRGQLTALHVEQVLRLSREGQSGQRVQLPGGTEVERVFDRLVFARPREMLAEGAEETTKAMPSYEYSVTLPEEGTATVVIPEIQKRLCLKVIDWPGGAGDTSILDATLDRDLLRPPLIFRNWRPGDAYRPVGRQGTRKVKRLFQEHRVPARERTSWPVLTSSGKLAWAGALPVAEEFATSEGTRAAVVIGEETL
ncbi:MAG: tRNA lysidine(34) synthetase TilS [Acidobacteria bacterium]|nr:tRNA lysidine(34) synthetase TilS [Acidobacteriota bacterium]MBI3662879.1 tRNA lysidine(34) synthetase TilS [Acidobacteriota bacterium]